MTVLKRRTRMVNFRLSEDEYRELKNLCIANGARSVSDFARAAVYHLVGNSNGSGGAQVEAVVRDLSGKVEELDREVKRLSRLVDGPRTSAAPTPPQRSGTPPASWRDRIR